MFDNNVDYSKVKFIEFYGLRRSGNHATISWLMNNLNGNEKPQDPEVLIAPVPELGFISQRVGDVYHINDVLSGWASKNRPFLRGLIDAYVSVGAKTIIISYEEMHPGLSYSANDAFKMLKNSEKWTVLRDWDKLIASRSKQMLNKEISRKVFLDLNQDLIDRWLKSVHSSSDINKIHFDSWCKSKEYRDELMEKVNLPNKDHTSHVSKAGGGSSFKSGNPLERKIEEYPEGWKELIDLNQSKIDKAQTKINNFIKYLPEMKEFEIF